MHSNHHPTAKMYSVPSFDELSATLETKWATDFKVIPPKSSGKNGIMTGSMMYIRKLDNGRVIDDQIAFMGPPCTMLPPIRDGRVLYPKITLNLNRKDGKTDENDPKDEAYAKERDAFVDFIREMEMQTLKKVKENPVAYFGGKVVSADNVFIKKSLVEAEEDNYRTKLACKVDLKEEANGAREDIDWNHVRIDVQDVKLSNGEVEWKKITLEDITIRDKILPSFRSAYPYFEIVKNHRSGEMEGYCKIQWCLAGLQRIEKVHDMKRARDDGDADAERPSPSWMEKIKAYIKDKDDNETAGETVDDTVKAGVETADEGDMETVDKKQKCL